MFVLCCILNVCNDCFCCCPFRCPGRQRDVEGEDIHGDTDGQHKAHLGTARSQVRISCLLPLSLCRSCCTCLYLSLSLSLSVSLPLFLSLSLSLSRSFFLCFSLYLSLFLSAFLPPPFYILAVPHLNCHLAILCCVLVETFSLWELIITNFPLSVYSNQNISYSYEILARNRIPPQI